MELEPKSEQPPAALVTTASAPPQRAIVRIRFGPHSHRRAILEPGHALQVGRAVPAGLDVPEDDQLAEAHFELSWDGATCHLKDLGSPAGTLLGGQPESAAEVVNGSWVRAGLTDFSVFIEGWTPAPEPETPDTPEQQALKAQALEALNAWESPLYAVLDCARDPRIRTLLLESVELSQSLYEGLQGETMADVAPYLVELPKGSRLLTALVQEGWGKGWGIYLSSPLAFKDTRRHLRKFLMVTQEGSSEQFYFRFYDPRVLRVFLPTCTPEQRAELMGDFACFLLEGEAGELLKEFRSNGDV